MFEDEFDVDIDDMKIEKNLKIEFRGCVRLLQERFKIFVENLKKADQEFPNGISLNENQSPCNDEISEYIKEFSYSKIENLFQDQELIKSYKELFNLIVKAQTEYVDSLKLHHKLKKTCLEKKEEYEKFGSDSDWNVVEDDSSFYLGQTKPNTVEDINTKNGLGIYKDKNENIYCGNFENGNFQEGVLSRNENDENFSYFEGIFSKSDDSEKFDGIFIPSTKNEKKHKLIYFDGEIVFSENLFNGISISLIENQKVEVYHGMIKNGRKDGNDTFLISFSIIENFNNFDRVLINNINYENGVQKGKALLYYSERHLIEVDFNGTSGDRSIYLKSNVELPYIYIGDVKKNDKSEYILCSTLSKLIMANGDYYFGSVKDGVKEGEGRYYNKDSIGKVVIAQGIYVQDMIMKGKIYLDNNLIYDGFFENNSICKGTYYFGKDSSNASYKGGFLNGKRNGQGVNVYSDGSKYAGEWEMNKRQGHGTYLYSGGDIKYIGNWIGDQKNGDAVVEKGEIHLETKWENNKLLAITK